MPLKSITVAVDIAATFQSTALHFMGAAPRMDYETKTVQATTKDGQPLWEVQVVMPFSQYGKTAREVMTVVMPAPANPEQAIMPGTPVDITRLTARVNTGNGRVSWGADAMRPLNTPTGRGKAE